MTSGRSEDEQRVELDELREEIGATVSELAQRADVPSRVRARRDVALARGRELGEQAKTLIAEKAPAVRSPAVLAAAAALLLLLVARRRRRRRIRRSIPG